MPALSIVRLLSLAAILLTMAGTLGAQTARQLARDLGTLAADETSVLADWKALIARLGDVVVRPDRAEQAVELLLRVIDGGGLPTPREATEMDEELDDLREQLAAVVQAQNQGVPVAGGAIRELQLRYLTIAGRLQLGGAARQLAIEALSKVDNEPGRAALAAAMESRSLGRIGAAMIAAGMGGMTELVPAIEAALDGARRQPEVRALALFALLGTAWTEALDHFIEGLEDEVPFVRIQAIRALESLGVPEAIDALIARLSADEPESELRVREEIGLALAATSGLPPGTNGAAWQAWWDDQEREVPPRRVRRFGFGATTYLGGFGFGLDHYDTRDPAGPAFAPPTRNAAGEHYDTRAGDEGATFFGLPLRSRRILFVIDTSWAGSAPVDPNDIEYDEEGRRLPAAGVESRWERTRRELVDTLEQLAEVEGAEIGLVPYNRYATPQARGRLQRVRGRVRALTRAFGSGPSEDRSRSIGHALQVAFTTACGVPFDGPALLEEVDDTFVADTIVLVICADAFQGAPWRGVLGGDPTYADLLGGDIVSWNLIRGIQLHVVSFLGAHPSYGSIAVATGGWARVVANGEALAVPERESEPQPEDESDNER